MCVLTNRIHDYSFTGEANNPVLSMTFLNLSLYCIVHDLQKRGICFDWFHEIKEGEKKIRIVICWPFNKSVHGY